MSAILVEDLAVFAGETRLLGPLSFQVDAGRCLVIMGETGAGKSLIAQAILGALPRGLRAAGTVLINDRRVDDLSSSEREKLWGRELAALPQEPWLALDPLMAAWRQVAEAHRYVAGLPADVARARTARDLVALGLDARERRLPGALSGGMAQRVAFAAATAGRAPILIVDEPTKGLDQDRQTHVVNLLARVPAGGGSLVTITHDARVAEALGGDLIVLRDGDLVEKGSTARILENPRAPYTQALLAADPRRWVKEPVDPLGEVVLSAQEMSVGRGCMKLIEGFNLALHAGERVAVTGPSGIGKTTLLDTLAGLIAPFEGSVTRAPGLDRHAVQKLYQDPPAAFPPLVPIETNLRDIARRHNVDWQRVLDYLSDLKLSPSLLCRRPGAVSGGELQRLSLARALIVAPRVLLADEPTGRLDPITQKSTLGLIARVSRENRIAVVLVTHSAEIAAKWAGRAYSLPCDRPDAPGAPQVFK